MSTSSKGLIAGLAAYAIWGLVPLYWKLLTSISAIELLYSRLILTALTCLLLLRLRGTWSTFRATMRDRTSLKMGVVMALLLSGNWFAFMWAVNNGQVLQTSLGYFLCPIVIVLLSRFVQKEELGRMRWLAVAMAIAGVGVIIWQAGAVPMAAICISLTWASYGLLKKRSDLGPMVGLSMETVLLSPPSLLLLLYLYLRGPVSLAGAGGFEWFMLGLVGAVTAAPLILFSYAAQRMRLSTLGMGQYIVPSCHFAIAIGYGETVTAPVLGGFALIWGALVLYSVGGLSLPGRRKAIDPGVPR